MGLLIVLLGGIIGVAIVIATLGLLVYGMITRNTRRGMIASAISLGLSVIAMVVSIPFWITVFSGHGSRGEPLHLLGDDLAILVPVVVESLAFVLAAIGLARQIMRSRRGV